ncbi:hypothetical protein [Sinorhizobium meliloti]|uniref:hypothetical protein n=1 Tax=Rhizobium meliloti TaxID=382 RepID=UPI001294F0D4|nr:hypothetical protein [Sinorhizobium meliloti]MDW9491705.1 hypothetical protein [Sinorhizobium meliloti]MQV02971.1 hypothetical protein [Sinorhizobium meliloti]
MLNARPAKPAQIRALIETAGSRFISVEFVKKTGELRRMLVNPARLGAHLRRDIAIKSESHVRGAETRKANNPHLLNVWDELAGAPRTINLDTLTQIKIDGVQYRVN